MYKLFDVYASRIAKCEQKAKSARNKDDRYSWLAMAESWRQTAELQQLLERQERDVPNASKAVAHGFVHAP